MTNDYAVLDFLKVVARRDSGVRLEACLRGQTIAYALTTAEARNMTGELVFLSAGTEDDYYSITETLTVVSPPGRGLYLETHVGSYLVFLPLDKRGEVQIAADLERSATAYEAAETK